MEFRVLGSTEVVSNGTSSDIGSERQRRLLAVLTLRCPDIVPTDHLIEAIWGDAQPDNAVNALRTVVSRLRHSLDDHESGAGERIVSRPPGYALDVPPESIDANRFAELAVTGRRHLAEHDLTSARQVLGEALDMWHGQPYAEFGDEPWAQGDASRLQRQWMATREADIEARLADGLHIEALGDIQKLIDDEPLGDGPRGLLMRALYAGGRHVQALRSYQEYRELLAEESGLEPGPELARLEQRILDNDPELDAPSGRPLRGYRLHERLATTERGAIFRATQPGLQRDVAVEVIREEMAGDAAFVRSFELQGQALAQLGHANVVPVYDCWREPGGAYLVRRLLSGGSLADPDVLERLGHDEIVRVRSQVRSALDVAHQAGLVHGSISADDIQLDEHDTAYLANFRLGADRSGEGTVEEDDRSFDRLFDALIGPQTDARLRVAPPRVSSPYRGLAAFRESDVDVFFGRSRLVQEALATLDRWGTTFLVGPSGSGKSSVVHAGVIPALRAGELQGSEDWFVATMVPGSHPFAELEAAVLRVAVHPPTGLLGRLEDLERPLTQTIQQVLPEPNATALLVIDQFEELFTLTDADERDRFLAALGSVVQDPSSMLKVVATLRADYYDQPLGRSEIASAVKRSTVPVDALHGDELRSAIVEPARVVGVDIEPDLVARLVADASGRAGALPLLQYTLTRLYETSVDNRLSVDAYVEMGGLAGAIGARAEEIHDALDACQRGVCRRLFGRLVAVDGGTDTRRRARVASLRAAEDQTADLDVVADRFVEARLLLTDCDRSTREPTLEVAHEALFREWPRLGLWIEDDRETIIAVRHLAESAQSWRVAFDESELYRGARLAGALDLVADHADRLTDNERDFVTASRELAEAQHHRQQRVSRRLRSLLTATAVLLVAALVLGLLANSQRNRADDRAANADLERLIALAGSAGAVPQEVAILAGLEAHRVAPSPETLSALHRALTLDPAYRGTLGDTAMGGDITVLDDGHRIVTHTQERIELWDVETRTREQSWPFPGSEDVRRLQTLRSAAAGEGSVLVASAPDVTTVIETETGSVIASIQHQAPAIDVAVSPDEGQLAIALADGTVEVRDLADPDGAVVERAAGEPIPTLRWHPNGRHLALGSATGEVVLWEPAAGDTIWERGFTIGRAPVSNVGAQLLLLFSSDGDRLVVAGPEADGEPGAVGDLFPSRISVLSASDGNELRSVNAKNSSPLSLSWLDANETTVAISSLSASRVEMVNLENPSAIPRLHITNFAASASLPALGLFVTEAGIGLDLHSVDSSNGLLQRVPRPPGPDGFLTLFVDPTGTELIGGNGVAGVQAIDLDRADAAWEPFKREDGDLLFALAAGSGVLSVNTAGLWGAHDWDGQLRSDPVFIAGPNSVSFVAMSPRGDRLMMTVDDQDILFDVGDEIREVARLERLEDPVTCCGVPTFSTDGALYSRLDRRGGTEVFDAATGERVPFDHRVEAQLLGPFGEWFLAVDDRGTIHMHDQVTGERIGTPMVGNRGPVTYLLPTQDQRRIAAIGANGSTRVWDLETQTQVGRQIDITHGGFFNWSADGRFLATYVEDANRVGQVEVWNFDTDTWPDLACELAGRNMTEDEWEQFGPRTIERRATCDEYPL